MKLFSRFFRVHIFQGPRLSEPRFFRGHNLGQNIQRLFHFLAQFLFTTSERELDDYHQKVKARVASRVAKPLKSQNLRKLGNFKKIPKTIGFLGEYPAVHPKAKLRRFSVKNRKKSAVKHFIEKLILLNSVNLSPTFCPTLCEETNFHLLLSPDPLILHFLKIFVFENTHSLFQLIFEATHLQKIPEYHIFKAILFCT